MRIEQQYLAFDRSEFSHIFNLPSFDTYTEKRSTDKEYLAFYQDCLSLMASLSNLMSKRCLSSLLVNEAQYQNLRTSGNKDKYYISVDDFETVIDRCVKSITVLLHLMNEANSKVESTRTPAFKNSLNFSKVLETFRSFESSIGSIKKDDSECVISKTVFDTMLVLKKNIQNAHLVDKEYYPRVRKSVEHYTNEGSRSKRARTSTPTEDDLASSSSQSSSVSIFTQFPVEDDSVTEVVESYLVPVVIEKEQWANVDPEKKYIYISTYYNNFIKSLVKSIEAEPSADKYMDYIEKWIDSVEKENCSLKEGKGVQHLEHNVHVLIDYDATQQQFKRALQDLDLMIDKTPNSLAIYDKLSERLISLSNNSKITTSILKSLINHFPRVSAVFKEEDREQDSQLLTKVTGNSLCAYKDLPTNLNERQISNQHIMNVVDLLSRGFCFVPGYYSQDYHENILKLFDSSFDHVNNVRIALDLMRHKQQRYSVQLSTLSEKLMQKIIKGNPSGIQKLLDSQMLSDAAGFVENMSEGLVKPMFRLPTKDFEKFEALVLLGLEDLNILFQENPSYLNSAMLHYFDTVCRHSPGDLSTLLKNIPQSAHQAISTMSEETWVSILTMMRKISPEALRKLMDLDDSRSGEFRIVKCLAGIVGEDIDSIIKRFNETALLNLTQVSSQCCSKLIGMFNKIFDRFEGNSSHIALAMFNPIFNQNVNVWKFMLNVFEKNGICNELIWVLMHISGNDDDVDPFKVAIYDAAVQRNKTVLIVEDIEAFTKYNNTAKKLYVSSEFFNVIYSPILVAHVKDFDKSISVIKSASIIILHIDVNRPSVIEALCQNVNEAVYVAQCKSTEPDLSCSENSQSEFANDLGRSDGYVSQAAVPTESQYNVNIFGMSGQKY